MEFRFFGANRDLWTEKQGKLVGVLPFAPLFAKMCPQSNLQPIRFHKFQDFDILIHRFRENFRPPDENKAKQGSKTKKDKDLGEAQVLLYTNYNPIKLFGAFLMK